MAHELYRDISGGPSLEKLTASLRWFEECHSDARALMQSAPVCVYFTLEAGSAFDCFVVGMRWLPDLHPNQIWVEVVESKSPQALRWSGIYNFRTHKGRLAQGMGLESPTLVFLDAREAEYLALLDIRTVADLIACDEVTVCESIVAWFDTQNGSENMNFQTIASALAAFGIIRAKLKVENLHFAGISSPLPDLELTLIARRAGSRLTP